MCAIAGLIGLPLDAATAQAMLQTMARRGPDGQGIYKDGACTLLHTRLAIIDPDGGRQPMTLEWEGETYTVSYNGELYNTDCVRQELRACGHTFQTRCDTEVLLHAFAQWGQSCLERLNGIFAFAVWMKKAGKLFLARDRMGVKPLFYTCHAGGLLFASEIKTLLAYPTVEAKLDANGVGELILLGPGRTPGSGVFQGIYEVEPGCCGWYTDGKLSLGRYWQLTDRIHTDSFDKTVSHVRDLVMDAITRQMVSDMPVGTFLSGGLDSSLISAVCAKELSARGKCLDTFSLDYVGNDRFFVPNKFQPGSDTAYIHLMEKTLRTCSHFTQLGTQQLLEHLEAATVARDLPGMADVDFSLLAFCGDIRKHVKVALSGECADEIFGGYPWFRDPEIRQQEGFPWAQNTAARGALLHPQYAGVLDADAFVMDRWHQTVSQADILPGTSPAERKMKEMVYLNQRWFMQTLLDRKDRMSMYHGLEVRVPFCDYRIAEYLYAVPWEYKDYRGKEKGLLRTAMEGVLPEQVLWRKKSPYPKTYDPAYLEAVRARLQRLLEENTSSLLQLVSRDRLVSLLEGEDTWPWYGQLMRRPQTIAYMLQLDFWLREYNVILV